MKKELRIAAIATAILSLAGCAGTAEVRVRNDSAIDFDTLTIEGVDFGDLPAGATSDYQAVPLTLRYGALELEADGRRITGQTLNFGSDKFTYEIDIADLDRGHLAIEVVAD